MGGLFGGGSSTPSYIPQAPMVQAYKPNSVDANKAASDAEDKIKKQLAAKNNTSNDIATSPLGVVNSTPTENKVLLGQ